MESNTMMDKIKKLLETAKRGGTEHEMQIAMEKVHLLLAKHNLCMSDVAQHKERDAIETPEHTTVPRKAWQNAIYNGLCKLYFCKYYYSRNHNIIGRPSNIAVVKALATYICDLGDKLACEYKGLDTRSYRASFRRGFASRIYSRCVAETQRAQSETTQDHDELTNMCTSLVLAPLYNLTKTENETFLASVGIKLGREKRGRLLSNVNGSLAGRAAAENVNIRSNGMANNSKQVN